MAANNELQAKLFADRVISNLEASKIHLSGGEISKTDGMIHCFREFYSLQETIKYISNTFGVAPSLVTKYFMDLISISGQGSEAYFRHSGACEKIRQVKKEEESNVPSTSGRK